MGFQRGSGVSIVRSSLGDTGLYQTLYATQSSVTCSLFGVHYQAYVPCFEAGSAPGRVKVKL